MPSVSRHDADHTQGPRPGVVGTSFWAFVIPGIVVVLAGIILPCAFTLYMSLHELKLGPTGSAGKGAKVSGVTLRPAN